MCNQFTIHHKFRIDTGRTKEAKTDSILHVCGRHRVLLGTSKKYGRNIKTLCIGLTSSLLKRKDWSSIKHDHTRCHAIILYDTLPADCISKVVVMKSEEIKYQKMSLLDTIEDFLHNWTNEFDSEVAESSNDTQRIQPTPKTQLSRTARPLCGQESTQSCVLIPVKIEEDQSNKNGETRKSEGARHWLQRNKTVTCSCDRSRTSPSSRACEEDRMSSSSRTTSSRLAAEKHLQPIQQKFESDDPRNE